MLLGGYFANAQQQEDNQWTLEDCIEYAAKHNLQVKQSELDLLSSKVEVDRSKADLFPTLNAGASYGNSVGRSIDPYTNIIVDDPVSSQNYYISSGVDLFNGFSKQNIIKQNKASLKASEFELMNMKNDISLQIVSAYTSLMFNQELLANAESRLEASGLQRDRTERQVEVGALPQASLYELEAQYASDELAVTNALNNLEFALLNLKQLLQLPADQQFGIVVPDVEIESAQEYPVSAEEVYEVAEDTQPIILAAESRIESSEYSLQAAKGGLWPRLSAQANLSSAYSSLGPTKLPKEGTDYIEVGEPKVIGYFVDEDQNRQIVYTPDLDAREYERVTYMDQLDMNFRRSIQLNLDIPIFNGLSTKSNISRARIANDRASLQAQIVRQQLRQSIEQAAQDVKAAALTYRSNLNQVRSLREAFRSVEQRFNLGAANAVDFSVAKTNLDVAESNLIRAKYDYVFKNKILDFYRNKPLSFD